MAEVKRLVDVKRLADVKRRTVVALATAGIGLAGLVGCASSTPAQQAAQSSALTTTSAAPQSTAAACTAVAELQAAVNNLAKLDVAAVGIPGVRAALQNVGKSATNLANAAQPQFGPEATDLSQAVGSLKATVAGLKDTASVQQSLGKLASSLTAVGMAAQKVVGVVQPSCPAPSSSSAPAPSSPPTS